MKVILQVARSSSGQVSVPPSVEPAGRRHADPSVALPPVAWRSIAVVLAGAAAVLLSTAGRYGYHRDELYFLAASKHLAWGYDDQPPLAPFLIRVETALFGDSVRAVRLAPALFALGLVLLAALNAREFAGNDARRSRRAQGIAALCTSVTFPILFGGHIFVTATLNWFFWALLLWLLVRWIRTRDVRLWAAMGVTAGIGLLNNNLVLLLAFALAVAIVITGPRDVFRGRAIWGAALVALLIWAPNLGWQATHGWPELEMARHIADGGERVNLVPFQIETALFLTPIWVAGWLRLMRDRNLRAYRFLPVCFLAVLALILLTGGKRYYSVGCYPALLGAGAVAAVDWFERAHTKWSLWSRRLLFTSGVALTSVIALLVGSPTLPVSEYSAVAWINPQNGETIGWPQLAQTVAMVYRSIPLQQRSSTSLIAENYGEAGALARYGPALGLPTPYAAHDGYARFGMPTGDGVTIAVGYEPDDLAGYWSHCEIVAHIDNGLRISNTEQGRSILECAGRRLPWAAIWHDLLHYS